MDLRNAWQRHASRVAYGSEGNDHDLSQNQRVALERLKGLPDHLGPENVKKLYSENHIVLHRHDPIQVGMDTGPTHEATKHFSADHDLHTSQDHLYRPALEKYVREGHKHLMDPDYDYEDDPGSSDMPYHPETFTHQDKDWIGEGHHRILADRMVNGGWSHITTHHRNLDNEPSYNSGEPEYDYDAA